MRLPVFLCDHCTYTISNVFIFHNLPNYQLKRPIMVLIIAILEYKAIGTMEYPCKSQLYMFLLLINIVSFSEIEQHTKCITSFKVRFNIFLHFNTVRIWTIQSICPYIALTLVINCLFVGVQEPNYIQYLRYIYYPRIPY